MGSGSGLLLQVGLVALLATTCLASSPWQPSRQPIVRHIVDDLTAGLQAELTARRISTLLVLGPHSDKVQLNWEQLGSSIKVVKAESADAFATALQGPLHKLCGRQRRRWWQRHAQALGGGAANASAQPQARRSLRPRAQQQEQQQHADGGGGVAVLSVAPLGVLGLQELQLAAAASAHLRQCLQLSVGYSTHADKGDSLIAFDAWGQPLAASFLATNVFRDTFSRIYAEKMWGSGGGGSGDGSTLNYTATVRSALTGILLDPRWNISSMLDSSCGSMHWMPVVLRDVTAKKPGFRFHGTDVACPLIERHRQTFAANAAQWRFDCVDYANQRLPSGYDLVFSRDSLQHVPLHAVWQFLNNIKASGARYLLVGSYLKSGVPNTDIPGGGYQPVDLTKPPFNVQPQPLLVIDERSPDAKHMLLYDVRALTWSDDLYGLV